MPIEIFNPLELAHEQSRTKVLQTNRFHAVVLRYATPGERDEMHCHDQDQTFYAIEGECTLHFPDGAQEVLKPGMLAAITGGSFYQLENSGDGPMVMLLNRSGARAKMIDYETRKEITEHRHTFPTDA
jgi:uncharacterized cupin superfamily protein